MPINIDALLIAGMHRSGTSAFACLASALGYYLGDNLMVAGKDNPRGYFEDQHLMNFSRNFLKSITGDGDHGTLLSNEHIIQKESMYFEKDAALQYLSNNGFFNQPFAFKDPRLCLTLPLWTSMLKEQSKKVACLIPFRSPLSVAQSLQKRNNFTLEHGLTLWFVYTVTLLKNLQGTPFYFIDYDELLDNTDATIKKVASFLGTDPEKHIEALQAYKADFLTTALCHHRSTLEDCRAACVQQPMVAALYADILALTHKTKQTHAHINSLLKRYTPYLFYANLPASAEETRYQLFFDTGNGFSEEDSLSLVQDSGQTDVTFTLPHAMPVNTIRFDVGNEACIVCVSAEAQFLNGNTKTLHVTEHNALKRDDNTFAFATNDPRIVFDCGKIVASVRFSVQFLKFNQIGKLLSLLNDERVVLQTELNDKQAVLAHTQTELSQSQTELAASYTEALTLKGVLDEAHTEAHALRSELEASATHLASTHNELEQASNKLEQASNDLTESQNKITHLQERHKHFEQDLRYAAQENQDRVQELEALRGELSHTQNDLAAAYSDTHTLRGELEAATHNITHTQNALAQSQNELEQAQTELANTQNELAFTHNELAKSVHELGITQNALEQAQNDLTKAYSDIETAEQETLEAYIESDEIKSELAYTLAELTRAHNELIASQTELTFAYNALTESQSELTFTQNELAESYIENESLKNTLDEANAALMHLQECHKHYEQDLRHAAQENQDRAQELEALRGELGHTQNDLAQAYMDVHTLRSEVDTLRHEHHTTATELQHSQEQLHNLHNELEHTRNELAQAYIQNHALHKDRDGTLAQVEALRSSLSWGVTAPLRLGYDMLAWPFRAAASFNMRRFLVAVRYSTAGNALYNALVSQKVKNRINRAWSDIPSQPSLPVQVSLPVQASLSDDSVQEAQPAAINHVHIPEVSREPVFIPDPAWYEEKNPCFVPADCPVKIIAFYLPQFHPIPENDEWWGEGFTEWTNVTKAKPLFDGHYQPRLPGAMGYYDLRLPDVLRKQAALAKEFGIHGFCFHHYYFAGKRLLETPVNNLMASPDIDLPFCLCWANENWTRRWDGLDKEILIAQEHSPEDDIRFLDDIQKYFDDPRYIRVDGKPFLIIYKANQFPDMAATIVRWREHAAERGEGLYLVMAQTFGELDPRKYGFDAAVEFPPHNMFLPELKLESVFTTSIHQGHIYDARNFHITFQNEYKVYKTLFPQWDNSARKKNSSDIFILSSAYFKHQLDLVVKNERDNFSAKNSFVFINAWNEWAEGAYLEPDKIYGYAFLNAVSAVLNSNFIFGRKFLESLPIRSNVISTQPLLTHDFTVIIPIYNGYWHLKTLFDCLLEHTEDTYKIILIDDASTDANIHQLIDSFMQQRELVECYRNAVNKGFSFSVNFAASKIDTDFIILNTDTLPSSGWTKRMLALMRQNYDSIASVTPFSNAATIFSFPKKNNDNMLFYKQYEPSLIDSAASHIEAEIQSLTAPTGVGFCMAINRVAWEQLGGFDEKTFGRGYGEEVDWCRRAIQSGWKNVLAPNVYVAHFHGGSFTSSEKQVLLQKNQTVLETRWPDFIQDAVQHDIDNPWENYRTALILLLLLHKKNKPVLLLDHNLGGGANIYAEHKMSQILASARTVAYLTFHPYWGFTLLVKDSTLRVHLKISQLQNVFNGQYQFSEIILNNFVHWTTFDLESWKPSIELAFLENLFNILVTYSKDFNVPIKFLLHDYFCLCPSYNLLNAEMHYCELPDSKEICTHCLAANKFAVPHEIRSIHTWRKAWKVLFTSTKTVEVFSQASKQIFLQIYPEMKKKIMLNPHELTVQLNPIDFITQQDTIHIGCVGTFTPAKGSHKINELFCFIEQNKIKAKIFVIGEFLDMPAGDFYIHGKYERQSLHGILRSLNIHVAFIPSIWPETFHYISSELIQLNMPLVCYDYGAQKDKVAAWKYGVVVKTEFPQDVIEAIQYARDVYYSMEK